MSAPALAIQQQGLGAISADNANTWEQTCDTVAQLRALTGVQGVQVFIRGYSVAGDGGAGPFYWSLTATAADDNGVTTIAPAGYSGTTPGRWIRLGFLVTGISYSYQAPLTGFSITVPNGVDSLILNPLGTLAAGTITFPSSPEDGEILTISSSQIITALTLSTVSGQTISTPISTLAAGGAAHYQYVAAILTWFKV